jgi:hypothetical protein
LLPNAELLISVFSVELCRRIEVPFPDTVLLSRILTLEESWRTPNPAFELELLKFKELLSLEMFRIVLL